MKAVVLTPQMLQVVVPDLPTPDATVLAAKLVWAGGLYSFTDARQQAHLLGQMAAESRLRPITEDMAAYTVANLIRIWPNRFTPAVAARCVGNAEAVGDIAYGGRNGNNSHGDGNLYRGRGFLQITGRYNYGKYGEEIGLPLIAHPEYAAQIGAGCLIACAFFRDHGCLPRALNGFAPAVIDDISYRVNGGLQGYLDRRLFTTRAAKALGVL